MQNRHYTIMFIISALDRNKASGDIALISVDFQCRRRISIYDRMGAKRSKTDSDSPRVLLWLPSYAFVHLVAPAVGIIYVQEWDCAAVISCYMCLTCSPFRNDLTIEFDISIIFVFFKRIDCTTSISTAGDPPPHYCMIFTLLEPSSS